MQFANKEIQSNCLRNGAIWIYIVCLCLCIPHWTGWSGWLVVDPQGGWKPKVCVLLCYCHHSMLQFKISLRHKFTEKHWCFFLSLRHTHTWMFEVSNSSTNGEMLSTNFQRFQPTVSTCFNQFESTFASTNSPNNTLGRSGLAKLPRRPSLGLSKAQNFDPFWLAGKIPCFNDLISRMFPWISMSFPPELMVQGFFMIFHSVGRWPTPVFFFMIFPPEINTQNGQGRYGWSIAEGPRICGMVFFDVNFAGFCWVVSKRRSNLGRRGRRSSTLREDWALHYESRPEDRFRGSWNGWNFTTPPWFHWSFPRLVGTPRYHVSSPFQY